MRKAVCVRTLARQHILHYRRIPGTAATTMMPVCVNFMPALWYCGEERGVRGLVCVSVCCLPLAPFSPSTCFRLFDNLKRADIVEGDGGFHHHKLAIDEVYACHAARAGDVGVVVVEAHAHDVTAPHLGHNL